MSNATNFKRTTRLNAVKFDPNSSVGLGRRVGERLCHCGRVQKWRDDVQRCGGHFSKSRATACVWFAAARGESILNTSPFSPRVRVSQFKEEK